MHQPMGPAPDKQDTVILSARERLEISLERVGEATDRDTFRVLVDGSPVSQLDGPAGTLDGLRKLPALTGEQEVVFLAEAQESGAVVGSLALFVEDAEMEHAEPWASSAPSYEDGVRTGKTMLTLATLFRSPRQRRTPDSLYREAIDLFLEALYGGIKRPHQAAVEAFIHELDHS